MFVFFLSFFFCVLLRCFCFIPGSSHLILSESRSLDTATAAKDKRSDGVMPRMGTNAALASRFSSDELAQARIKLRQNSEEMKSSSIRFNADGTSSQVQSSSKVAELQDSTSNSNETASSTTLGVSSGYHRRDQTRKYGARPDRKKGSTAGSTPPHQPAAVSKFGPKLDPREELMLAIRNAGGRDHLRKVMADIKCTLRN